MKVYEDGTVTGTFKHVTGYTQFNASDPEEQEGYFFPFNLTKTGEKMTFKKNGEETKKDIAWEANNVFRVTKTDTFELLDVISSSSGEVSTASAACVYKIPAQIPQLHNISEETAIYTKNDTQEIIPASVTKVMTAITALDYADSLSEKILFKPSDLESGSGAIFQAGDIITLNDALVAMLLPSSNMAATAIARNIGKLYLEKVGNRKA